MPFVLRMKVSAGAFVKVLEGAHGDNHLTLHSPEAAPEMRKSSKEKPIGRWGSGQREGRPSSVAILSKVHSGGEVGGDLGSVLQEIPRDSVGRQFF